MSRLMSGVVAGLFGLTATVAFAQPAATPATQKPAPAAGAKPVTAPPAMTTGSTVSDAGIRVLLIALRETTLSSPVAAKISLFDVSLGRAFAAGQTLITFECDEPIARVNMAKAELAGAVETHEAKVRMQGLDQASGVEVALAASAVAKARAQIALYASQVRQCSVSAPWAGRVSKLHVARHMSVTPGQALVDLVMDGPLRLKLNVPSSALSKIKTGQTFEVKIDETGKSYQARIAAINSRIDAVSQTIEVEATMVAQYPGLLPGMSGIAKVGGVP
jgi:RND family efflux transporter MFP subunit